MIYLYICGCKTNTYIELIIAITKKNIDIIPLFLAGSLVCAMFSFFLSSLFLGISFILSFLIFDRNKFTYENCLLWLIISIPFFLSFISLFFSYDVKTGIDVLVKRIPIVLIPFISILTQGFGKRKFYSFFLIFAIGCFLINLYGLINGFFFYLRTGDFFDPDSLFYIYPLQHVYLAAYNVFVLLSSIFLYPKTNKKKLLVAINIVNMISFILLSSKMAMFILLISIVLIFLSRFKLTKAILAILALSIVVYLVFTIFVPFSTRLDNLFLGIDPRFVIWRCTWEQITSKSFFDFIPIGDFQNHLNYCYYVKMHKLSLEDYNTHNQYLEFWLTNGVIGLGIFVTALFLLFKNAVKEKKKIMFYFLIIITLFCLTESVFQRQYGIMFYAVLTSLFTFSRRADID